MPGFELVGKEERDALNEIFEQSNGVVFAHGFDALRNRITSYNVCYTKLLRPSKLKI